MRRALSAKAPCSGDFSTHLCRCAAARHGCRGVQNHKHARGETAVSHCFLCRGKNCLGVCKFRNYFSNGEPLEKCMPARRLDRSGLLSRRCGRSEPSKQSTAIALAIQVDAPPFNPRPTHTCACFCQFLCARVLTCVCLHVCICTCLSDAKLLSSAKLCL